MDDCGVLPEHPSFAQQAGWVLATTRCSRIRMRCHEMPQRGVEQTEKLMANGALTARDARGAGEAPGKCFELLE